MARKLSRRDLSRYAARQLLDGVSQKKVARQLAAYLIENRRTNEISVMVRDIAVQLTEHGHVTGTVTSALGLSVSTVKAIEAYAKDKTGAKTVTLDAVVDEAVLGGVKLELPGLELDTTIAHQLTLLKTRYKKA